MSLPQIPYASRLSVERLWPHLCILLACACLFAPALLGAGDRVPRGETALLRERIVAATAAAQKPRQTAPPRIEPKIVGGGDALPGQYPWMAGLLQRGESDPYLAQYCGGALIHPYWVLTAGHCVEGDLPENIDVLIGAQDLSLSGQGERIEVVEIILHPQYDGNALDADAALLRLARPANAPVLRVNSDEALEVPGVLATILGWGALDEEGDVYPSVLQEAEVPLVDFEEANAIWDDTLTPLMMAAGNVSQGGVDTCQGDSGGPLVLQAADGEWTLAGITSFGDGCARPNSPGVYTRVSQMRPWLLPILLPRYAAWESSLAGVSPGERRDGDGDLRDNFQEFAFMTDAARRDRPRVVAEMGETAANFHFQRPFGAEDEVRHEILYRNDLTEGWLVLDLADYFVAAEAVGEVETVTADFPPGPRGFVALRASLAPRLAHAARPVAFPGEALSTLDERVREDAFGRAYQEFYFPDQPLGDPVTYAARSKDFDLRLELYDPSGTRLLAVADSGPGGGAEELIVHNATAVPRLRVLSADGGSGAFRLAGYGERPALPPIGPNAALSGRLTTGSDLDDVYAYLGDYYKEDFWLELPPGFSGDVTITLETEDFDAYLIVLNAITNAVIAENDDIDANNLNFDAAVTVNTALHSQILIRVTTALEEETGDYTLSTSAF